MRDPKTYDPRELLLRFLNKDISGLDLTGIQFPGKSRLKHVSFNGGWNLRGTIFAWAKLLYAGFEGATDIAGAVFDFADLEGASFSNGHGFEEASFKSTYLRKANLSKRQWRHAKACGAIVDDEEPNY